MDRPALTGKDFAIGVLSVTAVILLTSLIIIHSLPARPAMAAGQGGVSGDFVVSSARLDNMTEALFILDSHAQLMNMYMFIPARNRIELMQQFDMKALQTTPVEPANPANEAGRGRPNRRGADRRRG